MEVCEDIEGALKRLKFVGWRPAWAFPARVEGTKMWWGCIVGNCGYEEGHCAKRRRQVEVEAGGVSRKQCLKDLMSSVEEFVAAVALPLEHSLMQTRALHMCWGAKDCFELFILLSRLPTSWDYRFAVTPCV